MTATASVTSIEDRRNIRELLARQEKTENSVKLLDTLVKTLYDQCVAQERCIQSLKSKLERLQADGWRRAD